MGMSSGKPSEINVTPLIDVLLVLLVIFMVITPMVMKLEQVQLPPTVKDVIPGELPVVVKLHADMTVAIDEDPPAASIPELAPRLRPKLRNAKVVFVDFDEAVPWSSVVQTVDTIRSLAVDESHDSVPIAVRIHSPED